MDQDKSSSLTMNVDMKVKLQVRFTSNNLMVKHFPQLMLFHKTVKYALWKWRAEVENLVIIISSRSTRKTSDYKWLCVLQAGSASLPDQ